MKNKSVGDPRVSYFLFWLQPKSEAQSKPFYFLFSHGPVRHKHKLRYVKNKLFTQTLEADRGSVKNPRGRFSVFAKTRFKRLGEGGLWVGVPVPFGTQQRAAESVLRASATGSPGRPGGRVSPRGPARRSIKLDLDLSRILVCGFINPFVLFEFNPLQGVTRYAPRGSPSP